MDVRICNTFLAFLHVSICWSLTGGGAVKQREKCFTRGMKDHAGPGCHWRGSKAHFISSSYYYMCVLPGLPPALCKCPNNLVFEASVQTCVPGYAKAVSNAALIHKYRTKTQWPIANAEDSNSIGNGLDVHGIDSPAAAWSVPSKRVRRDLSTSESKAERAPADESQHPVRHHKDPSKHPRRSGLHIDISDHHNSPGTESNRDISYAFGPAVTYSQNEPKPAEQVASNTEDGESPVFDVFPTWAIAFAVLCFLLLVILLVLYLY